MAIYKRKDTWWVDVTAPNGERIRHSAGTSNKTLAREYHDQLKVKLWRLAKLGEVPRHTWNEAVTRWLKEKAHKATLDNDKMHLRWLHPYLDGKYLDAISRAYIDRITEERRLCGVTNATVNRTLEVLRAILNRAANDWEWLERAPKVHMLHEPKRRIRYLTPDEARKLLSELPEHLADMAAFSLATGLRKANVTGLRWSQVDLDRAVAWIHPDQAKARKAITVPLNADALQCLRKQLDRHNEYVFVYQGHPIRQVNTKAWKAALHRAGITDFRWHDLRHTWASWHVQNGTPVSVLQELGSWESPEMVRKYAHLSAEHLAPYAGNVGSLLSDNS
jgi:integrase